MAKSWRAKPGFNFYGFLMERGAPCTVMKQAASGDIYNALALELGWAGYCDPALHFDWPRFTELAEREPVVLFCERLLYAIDRLHEGLVAQPERLMVHRHDQPCTSSVRHRDRLFGRAVVVDPRVVRADRHNGCIEGTVSPVILERRRDCGVAANEDAPSPALEHPARVTAPRVAADARTPVLDLDRSDKHLTSRCVHPG